MNLRQVFERVLKTGEWFKRPSDAHWHRLDDGGYVIFADGPNVGALAAVGVKCFMAEDWEIRPGG